MRKSFNHGYVVVRQVYRPEHNAAAPIGVIAFDSEKKAWAVRLIRIDETIPFGVKVNHILIQVFARQMLDLSQETKSRVRTPWNSECWRYLSKQMTSTLQLDVPKAFARSEGLTIEVEAEKMFQEIVRPVLSRPPVH